MKAYEAVETARKLDPMLPIYARIDGRGFSRFTRGMEKPFDPRMTAAMIETTRYLVQATHARIGYVQSDEISLVWQAETPETDILFAGKVQKLVSVLASMAAAKFARACPEGFEDRLPAFDCRVFQLPDRIEAANTILWRVLDCQKNSVSMVAQSVFSHRALEGKRQSDMHAMLRERGIDFSAYPAANRLGCFLARRTFKWDPATDLEGANQHIDRLAQAARPVLRSRVVQLDMPAFDQVANRKEVIFEAAEPFGFDCEKGRAYVLANYPSDHPRVQALTAEKEFKI
ncbi:tRNA(His) guanylyltransferase Thg1 family protein [Bradyrhizobium sp. USDA 4350]